jgi:hypothetical protein
MKLACAGEDEAKTQLKLPDEVVCSVPMEFRPTPGQVAFV